MVALVVAHQAAEEEGAAAEEEVDLAQATEVVVEEQDLPSNTRPRERHSSVRRGRRRSSWIWPSSLIRGSESSSRVGGKVSERAGEQRRCGWMTTDAPGFYAASSQCKAYSRAMTSS